jgi:lysozyme family protein
MADIKKALPIIFAHEVDPKLGPFCDTPGDKGGPTCYGVTIATYRRYKPGATVEDLKNIPMSDVEMIYRAGYWQPLALDEIQDQTVATKLMDVCINGGPGAVSALAQRACITCGVPVAVDGWIGPATRAAINSIPPKDFLNAFKEQQRDFYLDICEHDHTQVRFLYTWMRRAEWPLLGTVVA